MTGPSDRPPRSLISQIHFPYSTPPFHSRAPGQRREVETVFASVRLVRLEEQFYQYDFRCLLAVEREGETHVFLPCFPTRRLDALPLVRLADVPRRLEEIQARHRAAGEAVIQGLEAAAAAAGEAPAPSAGDVDGASFLRPDMRMLVAEVTAPPGRAGAERRWKGALAALDLFACFHGRSRDNAALPPVRVGAEAIALLEARCPQVVTESLRAAVGTPADGAHRFTGVVDRRERPEGQSGGFEAEVAVVTLVIQAETGAWRYERQPVWWDREEGDPWS